MKSVNEQFAEMQKKTLASLEPMQNMNAVAAEAFERIARKNYDLMGDLVEYAVAQVKTPTNTTNLQDVYEQRVAETKAFAEKVNARAAEYVALAGELGDLAKSKAPATSEDKASPVTETAKDVAAKASSATEAAKAVAEKAKATPAKAVAETTKTTPAKAVDETPKAAPAKAKPATDTAKAAPAKATASTAKATAAESKAKPATAKKKAAAKKTAAKSK